MRKNVYIENKISNDRYKSSYINITIICESIKQSNETEMVIMEKNQ